MNTRNMRHPEWLKVPLPSGQNFHEVRKLIAHHQLHTVCQSARCPNIGDCWNHRTATFMILGDICTRHCRFCAVQSGIPQAVDPEEPRRVAEAVKLLSLRYAVVTSVTREDLADGGASLFAATIREIRHAVPECRIEVLIPDFNGLEKALLLVVATKPDVLNHNIETVPSLYPVARPGANYHRSLNILRLAKLNGLVTKTGLMLGLGETEQEILSVLRDLRDVECDILTLGQYLQPSLRNLPIARYVTPAEFDYFKQAGMKLGFRHIQAGPLVRSSYHAAADFEVTNR